MKSVSRRNFLFGSASAGLIALGSRILGSDGGTTGPAQGGDDYGSHGIHSGDLFGAMGEVDHERNGFHPRDILTDFNYGDNVYEDNGQTVREYNFVAIDKEIEIAPGIFFPAWTYNGRIPGPTIRCTEGDRIRINFVNAGVHPHTIHFHGIHSAAMDGVPAMPGMPFDMVGPGMIQSGDSFTYEFDARPFGCHLYHCHSIPLKRHIHKGLYGAFIVDPPEERPPAKELMMMMNAFDTNFDGDNEVYAVNSIAFAYVNDPIQIGVDELVRLYLINITEFDPINSIHIHAEFFDYYDHGTTLEPTLRTVDTIMQTQAQRGILEFSYGIPGMYMFHAHQSEFAELGWMGMFHVMGEGDSHDS
ncbi:MAG: multicopper oxidase domain-containing protein [Chloroflexi bacterium]|nr:multicopper oxidase domain-containing protein [Chloroflexota bacterium]